MNGAITKPFIANVTELTYFDDPVMTFADSMSYGCTIELN